MTIGHDWIILDTSDHYLEFTIEPDETVTFVYEKDDTEIEYEENLPFETAKSKIGEGS